jgi:hypothetical protein
MDAPVTALVGAAVMRIAPDRRSKQHTTEVRSHRRSRRVDFGRRRCVTASLAQLGELRVDFLALQVQRNAPPQRSAPPPPSAPCRTGRPCASHAACNRLEQPWRVPVACGAAHASGQRHFAIAVQSRAFTACFGATMTAPLSRMCAASCTETAPWRLAATAFADALPGLTPTLLSVHQCGGSKAPRGSPRRVVLVRLLLWPASRCLFVDLCMFRSAALPRSSPRHG